MVFEKGAVKAIARFDWAEEVERFVQNALSDEFVKRLQLCAVAFRFSPFLFLLELAFDLVECVV